MKYLNGFDAETIKLVLPRMREWIEIVNDNIVDNKLCVLPRMREWIEISVLRASSASQAVLPRMREWIEIEQRRRDRRAV